MTDLALTIAIIALIVNLATLYFTFEAWRHAKRNDERSS